MAILTLVVARIILPSLLVSRVDDLELGVRLLVQIIDSLLIGRQLQLVLGNTLLSADKRRYCRLILVEPALRLLLMSALELCTDDTFYVVLQIRRAHRSFNLAKIPSASLSSQLRRWELWCSRILLILLGATSNAGFCTSILTEDCA